MAGPAPVTPVIPFPKDSLGTDEALSDASGMFCAGNGTHVDEETPKGEKRRLKYPKWQVKGEEG